MADNPKPLTLRERIENSLFSDKFDKALYSTVSTIGHVGMDSVKVIGLYQIMDGEIGQGLATTVMGFIGDIAAFGVDATSGYKEPWYTEKKMGAYCKTMDSISKITDFLEKLRNKKTENNDY